MKTSVAKRRPIPRIEYARPRGKSRFTIAEIDAGWAKVRELMRKETAQHAATKAR